MSRYIAKRVIGTADSVYQMYSLCCNGVEFGRLHDNSLWSRPYAVGIYSLIGKEFGLRAYEVFADRDVALAWAREQHQNPPQLTKEDLEEELKKIKEYRYQDEMSDDFAYTNGKIAAWDDKAAKVRQKLAEIS